MLFENNDELRKLTGLRFCCNNGEEKTLIDAGLVEMREEGGKKVYFLLFFENIRKEGAIPGIFFVAKTTCKRLPRYYFKVCLGGNHRLMEKKEGKKTGMKSPYRYGEYADFFAPVTC